MLINGTYVQKQLDGVRGYCLINKTNDTVDRILQKAEKIIKDIYDEKPDEVIPMELKMENAHIRIYDKSNTPIPGRIKVSLPENNQVFGKCPVNYEFKMDKNELFCGKTKKKSLDE